MICLLATASEGWEVVSSPLVAGSNALTETAATSGGIVAVCGLLSRADFTCQEGAVGLDIAGELASPIGPGWQNLVGQLKEAILLAQLSAGTVLIRLPIPLDIRSRYQPCERRRNLYRMPANSCLGSGCHSDSCPLTATIAGTQKSAAKGGAIRHLERRGKPWGIVFLSLADERQNWHAIWPGIRRLSGVGLTRLTPVYCGVSVVHLLCATAGALRVLL